MRGNKNWMDSFRTQSRENVYVLKVIIMEEEKEIKNIREVVDCPKGEAGVWYANNLLCRLANEALKGMGFDEISWREFPDTLYDFKDRDYAYLITEEQLDPDKDYAYMKSKDKRNFVLAEMKWYQQLSEENRKRADELKTDEIPENIISEVEEIIEKEHQDVSKGLGYCHRFWARKKTLLKERGYDWKSPAELDGNTFFD